MKRLGTEKLINLSTVSHTGKRGQTRLEEHIGVRLIPWQLARLLIN